MTARRLVLLCVLAAPVLSLLGVRGLNEPDEGRYTEIAREMLVTGDWIIPRIKGVPHWAKPPLTYWSVAASMAVFGYNEWAARLPSAVAAVITLLLVYLIGKDIAGRRAGVLAALALGSTLEFFALARIVNTDMIHTALITGACAAFWFWRRGEESGRPRPAWRFAFWICLGLGFLNKGPIPLMVVAGALAPFVFRSSLRPRWRRLGPGWGVPVLVVLGASWYLEAIRRKPELLDHFLFDELGDRVAEGL